MADVEIKFDEAKLKMIQQMLADFPKEMPKVMSRALNKTGTSVKTEIVRKLAASSKMKQKDVKKGISTKKATYKRWQYDINIMGKKIPLIYFRAKERKRTVTIKTTLKQSVFLFYKVFKPRFGLEAIFKKQYTIKRKLGFVTADTGRGRKSYPKAFIATMKSGHKGVFKSTGRGSAIRQLYGPSAGELFEGAAGIATEVQNSAMEKLEKNIDSQIDLILNKRKIA